MHNQTLEKVHSYQTAPVHLIDQWIVSIDDIVMIGMIFIDLRKTVDHVDHHILIHKLKLLNVSQTSLKWWFRSTKSPAMS